MKSLLGAMMEIETDFLGPQMSDIRWAQRWAKKHGVKKLGRDYYLSDAQVKAMAADYGRKK